MSDTRCADPTLQIDVDVMVLEYLLHQATKAQFRVLNPPGMGTSNRMPQRDERSMEDEAAAQRLLGAFQSESVARANVPRIQTYDKPKARC